MEHNTYNERDDYYKKQPDELRDLDRETLKLLDKVCEGVEVPTDEEAKAAADAHGDKMSEV